MEDIVAHHAASKVKVVIIQLLPHSNFYFTVNTIFHLMGLAYNDHLRFSKQLSNHNNYMPLSTPVHQLFLLPVIKKCQWY